MVKHLQAIRQLLPTNCLSVFDQFVGLVLEKLKMVMLKLAKKRLMMILMISVIAVEMNKNLSRIRWSS